jgi:eukaryotic-like serine/threonine-protein kinase
VKTKAESTTTRRKSNPERWQRLKNILAEALEQPSTEERATLLRRACADDSTLLREAVELLAYDTTRFEEFAQFAATHLRQDEHDRIGERLGAYAIVRELGRGGMGAVYLAERADGQFEKRVAIKVLKRGTDTDEVLRRFRMERQILANLDHPNITRLVDAGTTADGLPYFVMEFVEGTPITQFVQREKVDLRGRLKLFLKVCSAVELAHRYQIIHRDIKPGNVVVDRNSDPKLLDFGIAKVLSVDSDDDITTVVTERRLTPMYAAPEQNEGQSATIATDVYSLGALLYELLTNKPPYRNSNGKRPQNKSSECSAALSLPSETVTEWEVKSQLQGQLDQIVARAMHRDPAQRYSSAAELSEDIERHLSAGALRSEDVSAALSSPQLRRRNLNARASSRHRWYIAAVGAGAIILAAALLFSLRAEVFWRKTAKTSPAGANSTSAATARSIAVLPFENLSDDKENAYFADGIQDDLLTNLSKISDLKVTSRTSVMSYRGKAVSAREIGKALGVATILEGSVRRIGNRVRVNVQLIDAENDRHIWAEDYDSDLTDVFAIQSDLAKKITGELQAKLSPAEKAQIERKPTENSDAYLAFLQAHDLCTRPDKFRSDIEKAEELFAKATKLDPNFAGAFAGLAWVHEWNYHSFDPTPARREKARVAADIAIRLQPELPEAHLALGFYYYYCVRNYQEALNEFAIAKRSLPNSAEVYMAIGAIERRQGDLARSTSNLEKAASLSPKDSWILVNLAENYWATKNFEAADKLYDRAIEAAPNSLNARAEKARLAVYWKGDLSVMEKLLDEVSPGVDPDGVVTYGRGWLLTLKRKFPEALALLNQFPLEVIHDGTAPIPRTALEGAIYIYLNDKEEARSAFARARLIAEQALRDSPGDAARHITLGMILDGLGENQAAIAEGKHAVELLPESQDAFDGPRCSVGLAQIYAWAGEHDEALRLLDHSLQTPNGVSVHLLKLDPVWDPLRKDPRFQALIDKSAANR